VIAIALIIGTSFTRSVTFLASLFGFGVLLAFTAAQLAVVRLRMTKPGLRRPFRVPLGIRVGGADIPLPSVIGALLTAAVFVVAMVTHAGARYGGPVWLLAGLGVYIMVRRTRGRLLEHVVSSDEQLLPQASFSKILVPMKLGEIGEEMVATAVRLAQDGAATGRGALRDQVPLDQPLDAELYDQEGAGGGVARGGARARRRQRGRGQRAHDAGARARPGDRQAAEETGADLIVLGSAPRWRRRSRFFSPTVDYVLGSPGGRRGADRRLPQGVLEG
jgi:nucleotide-binding universal stress UspA family protein